MSIICKRRSVCLPKLVRLPSKSGSAGESTTSYSDGSSCPNSPAVKKTYRLVVLGSARCGKSSIVSRFVDKDFDERYLPTIENFHRKVYKIRGEVYQLDIMDRSGNDPFPAARKLSYITGDIFILVGSIDHSQSVDQMIEIYEAIEECKIGRRSITKNGHYHSQNHTNPFNNIPIVFVLNKIDLPSHKWQIQVDEAKQRLAKAIPNFNQQDCFIVCSALLNQNILTIFSRLFTIGKMPKYMNPDTHKKLRNELSADKILTSPHNHIGPAASSSFRRPVLQRMRSKFSKDIDDEIITDVNVRRPSLRTDLLLNRAKTAAAIANGGSIPLSPQLSLGSPKINETKNNKNPHCIIS